MASTKAISANAIKRNSGAVLYGGTVATTGPLKSVRLGETEDENTFSKLGSSTAQKNRLGADEINSSGTFLYNPDRQVLAVGGNVITQLAGGVSFDKLAGGANAAIRDGIHARTSVRTVLIDSWDYVTGVATYNESNPSNDSFGADDAIPTLAVPGEIAYIVGGQPTTDEYEANTLA